MSLYIDIYIYTYLCIYIYIQNYIDINIYIYILSGMHPQVSETIYSPDAEKYPGVNI
jgi:accessory gene regulator protein AgrB